MVSEKCVTLLSLVVVVTAVTQPPGIFRQPDHNIYYKSGETVQMPCEAHGEPRPSYSWRRNEIDFEPSGNDDRIVQLPNAGTLVISRPEDKDEGLYQCFAENEFGKSSSIKVNLREAKLLEFTQQTLAYHEAELGKELTLPCVPPESVPKAKVIWVVKTKLGGIDVVNYDDRVSMDREYRLRFTNVIMEDTKDGLPYQCIAMNENMRKNSVGPQHIIKLKSDSEVYTPVKYMWADQSDRFGLLGDTFNMKCIFSGNPTPDVHWNRADDKPLSERARIKSMSQELEIIDLQFEDEGVYECWATNTQSSKRKLRTFNVRVNSRPYFIQEPEDVEIGVGGNVEFTCMAAGSPEPDIDWFINGIPLKNLKDSRFLGRIKRPIESKMFLENVQENDYMVVQCNASNSHGYVFADVYLNVLAEEPTIIKPPERLQLTAEGRSVNLTCRVNGKPDPIITWYKDQQQITGGRYQILPSGDLNIETVVLADAGDYKCHAINKYNMTSAEGVLVVRRKTRIEQFPGDLETIAGSDAKFTCSGTTDPEEVSNLKILWLKDGKEITSNDQRMTTNIQDNSLTISGTIIRDSGTYTCVADNGLDQDSASAMLTVKGRPDAPTKVYHQFCNKNATIHWMPGSYNNAPIQYYILQYNTSFNPDQWHFGLKINSTLAKVNMTLSPYVNYTFRIIAYNKIGPSDPSLHTPVVCTTKPNVPFYHPRNLRTLGHQPNTLYIEWTPIPPIQQNGPGFYYMLQIQREGDSVTSDNILNVHFDTWQTNHYEMNVGQIYQRYNITIQAGNSIGKANEDARTIIGHSFESTPVITPTNLQVLKYGETNATLQWDFSKDEIGKINTKIRGEFMGFKIQFWEYNRKKYTIREQDVGPESAKNVTGNTFTAVVENMLPNTRMETQVSVMNNFFIGRPTDIVRFTTKPGLPGPVRYLRPINIGDTHVNLEWGPPEENRGDLMGYDISYRLVKGLDLGEMQEREPQIDDPYATNAYLSGLMPRQKYRIYVYARTRSGRGESYFIEVVIAKPGTPRIPKFTVSHIGSKNINVTWWINAFADSGTIVFVEYRQLYGAAWLRTTDEVVHTWKNIENLEPGTLYEIRIKATNGKMSVASGIDEIRTDGTAVASALIGNIGWFIGMLLAILLIIALIVLFVMCFKRGFRFAQRERGYPYNAPYSGRKDTVGVVHDSDQFGPEPRGYNNDYYEGKEYHDFDQKPPSYDDSDGHRPAHGEYEPYEKKPSESYDPDYDGHEPDKFNNFGAPRGQDDDRYDERQDYDRRYDEKGDGYDDRRDDHYREGYDKREDYDRRNDQNDRRDDYDRRNYDNGSKDDGYDRRDDYDRRNYNNGSKDDGYDRRDDYDRRNYDNGSKDDGYDRRDDDDRRDGNRRDDYDDTASHRIPSSPHSDANKPSSTFV